MNCVDSAHSMESAPRMTESSTQLASTLLTRLTSPDAALRARLDDTYGAVLVESRLPLLRACVEGFLARYGDGPVRVFRAPGRINLRGMHVDTHGGFLNLMTHQREVVVACRPREDGRCRYANGDPRFAPFEFSTFDYDLSSADSPDGWLGFIDAANAGSERGAWERYAMGATLRAAAAAKGRFQGIDLYAASDLPDGAALSSSSALCLAIYLAASACAGNTPDDAQRILATRDAEWFAGARTGTSDPAAMVLGRAGQLVNVSLLAERFSLDTVRRAQFPSDELTVLVADSRTSRSLSGANLVAYTRNRFAYSVALDVFRQEMAGMGYAEERMEYCDRLARISPQLFGGVRFLAALLMRVPEQLDLSTLRARYDLPQLDALLQRYFGALPEAEWPTEVPLRGPLVYGLAESCRAERFFEHIETGRYEEAGRLMFIGHAGDRVAGIDGEPHDRTVSLATLAHVGDDNLALEHVPGDYGASSPILDLLVDVANSAGALGASLTGAGIAGSVLALCLRQDVARVREAWEDLLSSEEYARLAGLGQPLLNPEQYVVENVATASADEFPGLNSR